MMLYRKYKETQKRMRWCKSLLA